MTDQIATISDVLSFWIDDVGETRWYKKDNALDTMIYERFAATWELAARGDLDDWSETPDGALALILVLDQFSRNMFRGEAKAFLTDAKALQIAKAAIAVGCDRQIDEPQRQFFYLPYMHSEDLTDQDAGIDLIGERMATGNNLYHAKVHRAVIERFGRFPYRNAALGQQNTAAEQAYIDAGRYEPE